MPILLVFSAVRARLFEDVPAHLEELQLRRDNGPGSIAIERDEGGVWVSAPGDGFVTPPVRVEAGLDRARLEVQGMNSLVVGRRAAATFRITQALRDNPGRGRYFLLNPEDLAICHGAHSFVAGTVATWTP